MPKKKLIFIFLGAKMSICKKRDKMETNMNNRKAEYEIYFIKKINEEQMTVKTNQAPKFPI